MSENLYGVVTAPEWLQGPVGPQGIPGKDGKDGKPGPAGKDATINGLPTVELKAGKNVNIQQSGDVLTISATGGGGGTGENGTTFTPAVSQDGVISWTNDGGLSNPDPVNIKGPEGKEGPIGKTGPAGRDGKDGTNGADGQPGKDGANGKDGTAGKDATINGVNTLTMVQGDNITLSQSGNELTISATGTDVDKAYVDQAVHTTMNIEFQKDGFGNFTADKNDNDINNHRNAGGLVQAKYTDDTGITYTYYYSNMESDRKPTFVRTYVEDGKTKQVLASVDNEKKVTVERRETNAGADVPIATTAIAGKVKPDGTTITITEDGTISSAGGGGSSWDLSDRIGSSNTKNVFINQLKPTCYGDDCFFVGSSNTGYQHNLIIMGNGNTGSSLYSFILGNSCKINGQSNYSTVIGYYNTIGSNSSYSFAEGYSNFIENAEYSHVEGYNTISKSSKQHVEGKYNLVDTSSTYAHIVGNGASAGATDNAYTLDWLGNGSFKGKVSSQGADYAEYFEWLDGNPEAEDRVGYIVTLDGNKIRKANAGEDVLGIISGTVGVLGDNYEWNWQGKYLTDDFGRVLYDMVEEFSEDEDGTKHSVGFFPHPRINPAYNPDEEYVNRANRPEWDAVGMMGKLYVRDDGTCAVNSYAAVGVEGVATASAEKTNMRVVERIKPNIVRVVLK